MIVATVIFLIIITSAFLVAMVRVMRAPAVPPSIWQSYNSSSTEPAGVAASHAGTVRTTLLPSGPTSSTLGEQASSQLGQSATPYPTNRTTPADFDASLLTEVGTRASKRSEDRATGRQCDVCSCPLQPGDSFALSTATVTRSEEYWRRYFAKMQALSPIKGTDRIVSDALRAVCADSSGWLVCADCVQCFVVDLDKAQLLAQIGVSPEDIGSIQPSARASAAARGWRQVTGRWLSTVRPVEKPVDACDFCTKPTYAKEPVGMIPEPQAKALNISGILPAPARPARTDPSQQASFAGCMTCMAKVSFHEYETAM